MNTRKKNIKSLSLKIMENNIIFMVTRSDWILRKNELLE